MDKTLVIARQGPVGRLTLNRPERHNAFDDAVIAELPAALRELEADPSVRVVVLAGAGKSFCAGADLRWMERTARLSAEENRRDAVVLAGLMRTLAELGKPTIARVQGPAYGGGVGLAACCDIVVATANATFALSEARLGLIPAVISPHVVAAIGERAARRYFMTAERFDAREAWRLGLVHEVADDEPAMDARIAAIAEALLACGPQAQREAKALVRAVAGQPVTDALVLDTAERIARVRASDEGREGMAAFLGKRSPAWREP